MDNLNNALKRIKKKKESLKEGQARFDKLVKAIKGSQTTTSQDVKLKKIASKIRKIEEMVSKLKDSDRRTPGPTINIKAKEVKDEIAKREPNKGSALANRGMKNNQMKDKRKPAPYSSGERKEKKQFKGPSKERIGNIAKGIHNAVKSAGSAVSKGYGQSSWQR